MESTRGSRGLSALSGLARRTATPADRTPRLRVFVSLWLIPVAAVLCSASPLQAAVDDFIGRPIASVRLVVESRETTDPALISVVETMVGQPLDIRAVRESMAHLFSLGR